MELIKVNVEEINGELVTTSNRVAEELGVNHKHLLEKIDNYIQKFGGAETSANFYKPSFYRHHQNKQKYRNYLITEKGVAQLVGGYSLAVEKAFDLNVAYINKFDEMKRYIQAETQKKLSVQDVLIATLEEQKKMEKRIDIVEDKLDNEIRIDNNEQRRLQRAVSTRVYQRLDVINADKKIMFPALYRDLKDRFGVASYRDVKRKDFKEALAYVQNWIEKSETREKQCG